MTTSITSNYDNCCVLVAATATGGGVDTSPNHCRASVLMNIASVCCVRKEMEKARKALLQACACLPLPQRNGPLHAKAILLSAYIELHTGKLSVRVCVV